MQREDAPYAALVTGFVVASGQRRGVVLAARAAGMTVDQWLGQLIYEKLHSIGLAHAGLGVDNGDEYGQRVVQHEAMVSEMNRRSGT